MPNKPVFAVDPGVTTGVALLKEDGTIVTKATRNVHEVFTMVTLWKPDVVCENFTTSGRISTYGLHTVRVIGGLQALCWHLGLRIVMRMPQERYSHIAQAKLKLKGSRHVIHEVDALAHLLKHLDLTNKRTTISWHSLKDLM